MAITNRNLGTLAGTGTLVCKVSFEARLASHATSVSGTPTVTAQSANVVISDEEMSGDGLTLTFKARSTIAENETVPVIVQSSYENGDDGLPTYFEITKKIYE